MLHAVNKEKNHTKIPGVFVSGVFLGNTACTYM